MTRYSPLFSEILKLHSNHKPADTQKSPVNFPFPTIYTGQQQILNKIKPGESFCLTSHTGFGKTPVFLSLIRSEPAIVIEPRKFLQTQVAKYYGDFVLFGRSGYYCPLAPAYNGSKTAAMAPCLAKVSCDETTYHAECQNANSTCLNKPCKVFAVGAGFRKYPCDTCDYHKAMADAQQVLKSGRTVICNFGNFWNVLKGAKTVVIDEADLFFREISAPMKLKYSNPKKNPVDTIQKLLQAEVAGLEKVVNEGDARTRYAASNLLNSAKFLLLYQDLCFKYQRKDSYYIEIDPRNVNILCEKLFKDKRVIIVSATPGSFSIPAYSASIHQRCGIYFATVGNLTSRSLKQNPYLMSTAAKAIAEISTYFELVYDADKVIVFCGNLGTHAASLYKILGEEDCILHQTGRLAESLDAYKKSEKKYFLVAGAEYGLDADWCKLQFLLKHPYPNLDERARTLQRVMGPEFNAYYENEARRRVIQTFGRNVRGFDDFGVTICLDSKTHDDYVRNKNLYPEWVQNRIDMKVY